MVALKDFGGFLSQFRGSTSSPEMWKDWGAQLEEEIIDTCLNAKYPRLSLANLARSHNVPFDVVEQLAQKLCQDYFKVDLDAKEFQSAVSIVEEIEKVEDPGLREFKLAKTAKRFGMNKRQLMEAYNKAICGRTPIAIRHISKFKQEFNQPIEWLIQGWIPQGVTVLLHALGGVGKTLLVYHWLACILSGQSWNGYKVAKGDALLVQVDEPEIVTSERLDIRGISDDAPLYVLSDWSVEQIHRLEAEIAKSPPKLLIIDSITAVNRNTLFSENDTEYARPILQIRDMARRYGCTVILIHHSNAEGTSRGTKAIHNSVDEVWALKPIPGCGDRLLDVQKTRLGRAPGLYRFAFDDDFTFRYLGQQQGDTFDADDPTLEARIHLWLGEHGRSGIAYAPAEVAEFCEVNLDSCRRALYELWSKGLIHRKRPPRSAAYLYYSPVKESLTIGDHVITRDHPAVITLKPAQEASFTIGDQGDHEKNENLTAQIEKRCDHHDHLDHLNEQSQTQQVTEGDHGSDPSDHLLEPLEPDLARIKRGDIKKGEAIEVYLHHRWIQAKHLGSTRMRVSPLTKKMEDAVRVEVGRKTEVITIDCVRLPGGGGNGQKPKD